MKIKNNRGSEIISSPIIIVLGVVLISTLIVFLVKILSPFVWYEKLSSTSLKYVFVMEEFGYLTNKEKNILIKELTSQGFKKENLSIRCTNQKQEYGKNIFLDLNYNYRLKLPFMEEKIIPMNIHRESVSKR